MCAAWSLRWNAGPIRRSANERALSERAADRGLRAGPSGSRPEAFGMPELNAWWHCANRRELVGHDRPALRAARVQFVPRGVASAVVARAWRATIVAAAAIPPASARRNWRGGDRLVIVI